MNAEERRAQWEALQNKFKVFCLIHRDDKSSVRARNFLGDMIAFETNKASGRRLTLGEKVTVNFPEYFYY